MNTQLSKDEIQDSMAKKEREDNVKWHERKIREFKKTKEKISHYKHLETLFFTYPILLEWSKQNNSNYILKKH